MTNQQSPGGLTVLGKLFSVVLILGLVGLGAWIVMRQKAVPQPKGNGNGVAPLSAGGGGGSVGGAGSGGGASATFDLSDLDETMMSVKRLDPAAAYVTPASGVIDIELSQYAGYAGIIAANGGLESSADSYLAKHGVKLKIKISEEESWSALNAGKMAASATTADVLAVYGRQFQVVVPAQIGYSRGADGLVVRNDIKKVNDLKGKIVSAAQFTESDFFIRYLAREAGISVKMLPDLNAAVDPESINVIYCKDGLAAGDFFVKALKAGNKTIAGCATWAPKTSEIPSDSGGRSKLLISNKNLLIIADILIVNRGWAEKNPAVVASLVDGLIAGNKMVRENPEASADVVGKALKWDRTKTLAELQKVHLANLPEQQAFFTAGITQGGSFASIYQSAILSYGNDLIPNAVDSDHFVSMDAIKTVAASGAYASQVAEIAPVSSGLAAPAESDPVLSKDIRFLFEPNSSNLDMKNQDNLNSLNAIKKILDVAPGSRIILVGHVDNGRIAELMKTGGQALVDKTALEAMKLSKDRATEVMNQVVSHEKIDPKRLEVVGKGWTQPVGTDGDKNRRVEVQWFTLE
jgi:NitT/TauT family transport system substrate-binding protein